MKKRYQKILLVGLGNPLLQDEGVGNYIIARLAEIPSSNRITLTDCGTDLLKMLSYFDHHDLIVFFDAVDGKQPPGTVYRFTKREILALSGENKAAHQLSAVGSIRLLEKINPEFQKAEVWLIGIQPASLERGTRLSPAVKRAADRLIQEMQDRFFRTDTLPGNSSKS